VTFADKPSKVSPKQFPALLLQFECSVCVRSAHFDVVTRKLIFELQARSQRVYKASMPRFRFSIDLKDIVLMRQTIRRNTAFHETPHLRPETDCENRVSASVPNDLRLYVNFVQK
jgi:hypothetical protein